MTAPPRQTMLATAPVSKLIWTFAIPAILSQVVNSMHNIVDQTFLGWGIGDLAHCRHQHCLSSVYLNHRPGGPHRHGRRGGIQP